MKKESKKTELEFVEALDNATFHVDTDSLWQEIEPRLEEKNKKRRLPFWFFLLSAIVVAGGLYLYQNQPAKTEPKVLQPYEVEIKDRVEAAPEESTPQYYSSNKVKENVAQHKNTYTQDDDFIVSTSASGQVEYGTPASQGTLSSEQVGSVSEKGALSTKSETSIVRSLRVEKDARSESQSTSIPAAVHKEDKSTERSRADVSIVANLPQLWCFLENPFRYAQDEDIWIQKRWTYNLGIAAGIQQNISSVSSSKPINISEYSFEQDRHGYSAKIYGAVEHSTGWRAQLGIEHHVYASSYRRKGLVLKEEDVRGIESYRVDENGTLTPKYGTITKATLMDIDLNWTRQHRAYDIVGSIGKRILKKGDWFVYVDIGASYNLATTHRGYYIKNQEFGFTKFSGDNHPYAKSTGWALSGNIELSYALSKQWRLGAIPYIRWHMGSSMDSTHDIKLKNSQIGALVSIIYTPR